MVSESDSSKKIDDEPLRISDIISSTNKSTSPKLNSEKVSQSRNSNPIPIETIEPKETSKKPTEIPKFNLAEEIMAEQRKVVAIKRKAPGLKASAQSSPKPAAPADYTISPQLSQEQHIIAEIVARDIERFCKQ